MTRNTRRSGQSPDENALERDKRAMRRSRSRPPPPPTTATTTTTTTTTTTSSATATVRSSSASGDHHPSTSTTKSKDIASSIGAGNKKKQANAIISVPQSGHEEESSVNASALKKSERTAEQKIVANGVASVENFTSHGKKKGFAKVGSGKKKNKSTTDPRSASATGTFSVDHQQPTSSSPPCPSETGGGDTAIIEETETPILTEADTKKDLMDRANKNRIAVNDDESRGAHSSLPRRKAPPPPPNNYDIKSPVAEITFTRTETKQRPPTQHNKRPRLLNPSDLHEPTLHAVKEYLAQNRVYSNLQDDELTYFMIRLHRVSTRQAEYQHHLVGDSDESEASLYKEILAEEVDHAVGHELFKTMVKKIKSESDVAIDNRTLNWIRKAARMRRTPSESLAREHAIKTDTSHMMKTRTAAKRCRIQKFGPDIDILADALEELEKENKLGPGPEPSRPTEPNASASTTAKVNVVNALVKFRPNGSLVARIQMYRKRRSDEAWEEYTKDVKIRRVIANGKAIKDMKSRSVALAKRVSSKTEQAQSVPPKANSSSTSLRILDWKRRQATSFFGGEDNPNLVDPSYRKSVDDSRTAEVKRHGFVCRLPQWDSVKNGLSVRNQARGPLQSTFACATLSLQLLNALSVNARSWAIHEFFYSDIDCAWYNQNPFVQQAAKLGIKIGARLTRKEWIAVRRRLSLKPRLFSKRFIASELSKRNKFRNCVRMLQRAPILGAAYNFPFEVPAPIRIGTKVMAYSHRFQMLQQGTVLSHDVKNARYLVLFDAAEFGCEFCPDTEVATHGGPQILNRPINSFVEAVDGGVSPLTSGVPVDASTVRDPRLHILPTRGNPSFCLNPPPSLSVDRVADPSNRNQTSIEISDDSLCRKVAEHEILVFLLSTAENAFKRKKMLLDAIEECSTQQIVNLPFGQESVKSRAEPSASVKEHFGWLRANLDEANQTLESTMYYIRLLYGQAVLPPTSRHHQLALPKLVDTSIRQILSERPPAPDAALEWSADLVIHSNNIGATLAAQIHTESEAQTATSSSKSLSTESRITDENQERLSMVGGMLVAASCCQALAMADPSRLDHHKPSVAALRNVAHNLLSVRDVPVVAHGDELYNAVITERASALEELKEALDRLATEDVVASTRHELQNQGF